MYLIQHTMTMSRVTMLHCPILRRKDTYPPFASWTNILGFLKKFFLREMRCLSLTLYIDARSPSSHTHSGLPLALPIGRAGRRSDDCRARVGGRAGREGGSGRKTNNCKCTHCMLCLIIMCNVAALTFYATIYEDIRCVCNKSREKACTWYCKHCA